MKSKLSKIEASEHGEAGAIFRAAKSLSPSAIAVLTALNSYTDDFCYVQFQTIANKTKMPIKVTRRLTRALSRKGLAKYACGLFNEDGGVAGSGYGITPRGRVVAQILQEDENANTR